MTRGVATAAAVACLATAVVLHASQASRFPAPTVDRPDILYIRSGATMRRLALDYDAAAADAYWIRTLQHFGRERLAPPGHERTYSLLYPLLDLTTTLDPYFTIAYRFGAIFLGEAYPGGPGRPDLAIALLEKGLKAQPQKWQYMRFAVEGVRKGKLERVKWDELLQKQGAPPKAFSFRYFQQLEDSIMLPPGFTPQRVKVSLSGGVEQSFPWQGGRGDAKGG